MHLLKKSGYQIGKATLSLSKGWILGEFTTKRLKPYNFKLNLRIFPKK